MHAEPHTGMTLFPALWVRRSTAWGRPLRSIERLAHVVSVDLEADITWSAAPSIHRSIASDASVRDGTPRYIVSSSRRPLSAPVGSPAAAALASSSSAAAVLPVSASAGASSPCENTRPTSDASAGESVRTKRPHADATLLLATTAPSNVAPPPAVLPPASPLRAAPPPASASSGSALSKASACASRAAHWTVAASALPDAPGTATASAAAASHAALTAAPTRTSCGAATTRRAYSGDGRKQRACTPELGAPPPLPPHWCQRWPLLVIARQRRSTASSPLASSSERGALSPLALRP
eukprot:scaffold80909_cov62-Phaeocystis_antarctica.AAC.8